tara:strand:+ start:71 stop:1528 length:1458 start_codon:yes stop_codon:yes gene_type:complete
MSLPSGLIFFLDFTFGGTLNTATDRLDFAVGSSLYGGGVVGSQITGGVLLAGDDGTVAGGAYNLRNGYSSPTGSGGTVITIASGTLGAGGTISSEASQDGWANLTAADWNTVLRFDPDISSGSAVVLSEMALPDSVQFNREDLVAISTDDLTTGYAIQRLSQLSRSFADLETTNNLVVRMITVGIPGQTSIDVEADVNAAAYTLPIADDFIDGGALGSIVGTTTWGLENQPEIPEIDIKVDSVAVTAVTKKLKAKWTPELGQDLNAYHNLDAEVELTQILSEQIALEIDREILEDLVAGQRAGIRYWSRSPGKFVNRETGAEIGANGTPDFTGNVSEWYETLVESINDVSAQIHRKTLRGAANFVVCGPEVANLLEFTAGFRANVTADSDRGDIGAVKTGSLSKKFDVLVDPYFPRNLILVGRRGSSFLESGYVYAPYVPLQTTPTIFGVEDFVPRKGVMTRYAKKMVRPDMYGLVVCLDMVTGG